MKRVTICAVLLVLLLSLAGCGASVTGGEKLCRIEIEDLSGVLDTAVVKDLSQEEVVEFFHDDNWGRTENVDPETLTPRYAVAVYQDATKTVLGDDDSEPLKIMEYVTYEDTDVVKCIIGEAFLPQEIVENYLEHYSVAPAEFFATLDRLISPEE